MPMADQAGASRSDPSKDAKNHCNRLSYAFDAGFLSGAQPPDTPLTVDDDEDTFVPPSSDSECSDSTGGESKRLADLAASVQVFSGSLLRMELAEMEMLKARETMRVEAERRRVESEAEMTQMLLNTQLEIASFVSRKGQNRKRKRVEEDDSASERQGLLLFGLLQYNLSL